MLDGFRKHSNSIIVKGLMFLLIASFAAWGVADMLRPAATGSSVATVGGVEVSAQEVYNDFQREMSRLRQLTGGQGLDDKLTQAIGGSVVERAISRTLLAVNADDMDVVVSDEQVAKEIRSTEAFQDNGTFSKARFDQVLFSSQLSEDQYIELVRSDLVRAQVVSILASGATLPESAARDLYKHRQEKRSADVVTIATDKLVDVATPADTEIQAYFDAHQDKFMAPEYRQVSLLHITTKDVADTIEVPEEDVQASFNERKADFVKPARRDVEQMIFGSEEEAKAAAAAIATGQSFAEVAKEKLGMDAESLMLGNVTKAELPEELRDATFALAKGGVSEPIQSMLGWHILRVTAVTEAVDPTFDEVKGQIREALALERAGDELFNISNSIEDVLGGGATIEEAADKTGFKLSHVAATDKQGLDEKGNAVESLKGKSAILNEIFSADLTTEPSMKEDGAGGYFLVRVDEVQPSTVRAFEEVKEAAASLLLDEKKKAKAKELAEGLLKKIQEGGVIADVAAASGLSVSEANDFTRFDSSLPRELTAKLFEANRGEAALGENANGFVVARLREIKQINDSDDQAAIDTMRESLTQGLSNDLQGEYVNALRQQYSVDINRGMVNRLFVSGRP